ncbi:unnamed protein product, partial [Staurois parvus]
VEQKHPSNLNTPRHACIHTVTPAKVTHCTTPNDGALFPPLTPMMGRYSPTDTNDGGTIPPLTPMMGHYSPH